VVEVLGGIALWAWLNASFVLSAARECASVAQISFAALASCAAKRTTYINVRRLSSNELSSSLLCACVLVYYTLMNPEAFLTPWSSPDR